MLSFSLFRDEHGTDRGGRVHIDPMFVAAVRETERKRGFYQNVAVIRMNDGSEYVVDDFNRDVAARINAAKVLADAQARAERIA